MKVAHTMKRVRVLRCMCAPPPSHLSPPQCVALYANVAACCLPDDAAAAAASAAAGLALPCAPAAPARLAPLDARLAAAQERGGDAVNAAATRAKAASLGLKAVDGGRWGSSRELDGGEVLPYLISGAFQVML